MKHARVWLVTGEADGDLGTAPVVEITTSLSLALAKTFDHKGERRLVEVWLHPLSEGGNIAKVLRIAEELIKELEGHVDDNLLAVASQEVEEMRQILINEMEEEV